MPKLIDLTGQRFERLLVIERAGSRKGQTMWRCRCDCGNERVIQSSSLTGGRSRSCGCLHWELSAQILQSNNFFRDGAYRDKRLFGIWSAMKQRCLNPNNPEYAIYGGRGIEICREWLDDFLVFQKWAFENDYREDLTIDRIDNEQGYFPENCRWTDMRVQSNNQRRTTMLSFEGKTQALSYWADEVGLSRNTLKGRLRRGWSVERALTEPAHSKSKN